MIFKIKTISSVLFFATFGLISVLYASDLGVPLPKDAVKILEKTSNFGPVKSFTEVYKTSLNKAKVISFYKKEMARSGWKQKEEGIFIKDKFIAVVVCRSSKDKQGQVEFTVTISNIPSKEEFLLMRKEKPDKLSYMPIYPGSVQLSIVNLPAGIAGAYETENSIEDVVFFYKTGMLNYGWTFDNEKFVQSKDEPVDCPSCRKLPGFLNVANKPKITSKTRKITLIFRRKKSETCVITVTEVSSQQGKTAKTKITDSPRKTTILTSYHAYKSNRP